MSLNVMLAQIVFYAVYIVLPLFDLAYHCPIPKPVETLCVIFRGKLCVCSFVFLSGARAQGGGGEDPY